MGLVKISEIPVHDDAERQGAPSPVASISANGAPHFVVGIHGADLEQVIPALVPDRHIPAVSLGHWSLHEMLAFLLSRIGPAECWLTSWGISTKPVQALMDMVRDKRITQLNALFDHRVRLQCPEAFQLLLDLSGNKRVDIRLTKIHAKVIVLRNANHQVTLYSSANLTTNRRIESYAIDTWASVADFNRTWIDQVRIDAKLFNA
ncbi:MAG TPA: hypothetical protein PLB89_04750 [Flavobacteriales bacterium]|nr:hypothetical protein [Flavobacteriales bacterium]